MTLKHCTDSHGACILFSILPMGFATELQGWSSHDALLSVQDAELRLLENMRRCIVNRVKCDREYSISLNSLCIQAAKVDTGDELSGSLIAKVILCSPSTDKKLFPDFFHLLLLVGL